MCVSLFLNVFVFGGLRGKGEGEEKGEGGGQVLSASVWVCERDSV